MNSEEKPFPCKIEGCKQSFATEDHLEAHRKKHEKILNLDLPNKLDLFADQTPTPTRLIGKCEEVGLFEDLQHVNPFEETFRRAVEEKSSGTTEKVEGKNVSIIESICNGDDTLHTPHVFPLLERRDSRKLSKLIISRSSSKKDDVSTTVTQLASESRTTLRKKQQTISEKPLVNILPKAMPPTQPVIIISCEKEDGLSMIKTANPLHPVKAKLKKYLARNGSLADFQQASAQTTSTKIASAFAQKTKSPTLITKNCPTLPHVSNDVILQKHERWKAAAKRYRTRVKQNQDGLQRKNMELEAENLRLKTELAQLKHAFSLHKNCSVTSALFSGTDIATTTGPSNDFLIPGEKRIHQHLIQPQQSVQTQFVNAVSNISNPVYIILGGPNHLPGTEGDNLGTK